MNLKRKFRDILCAGIVGNLIYFAGQGRVRSIRWPGIKYDLRKHPNGRVLAAWIFWGVYESAELRTLRRYFSGEGDVVELGTSSGIVAANIVRKMNRGRFIAVEANQSLRPVWESNVIRLDSKVECVLLNYMVGPSEGTGHFNVSTDSTASAATLLPVGDTGGTVVEVECRSLSSILNDFGIQEYTLFSDIEGAEAGIILRDSHALQFCTALFIELHDIEYEDRLYSVEDLVSAISSLGFRLINRDGNVFYFKK